MEGPELAQMSELGCLKHQLTLVFSSLSLNCGKLDLKAIALKARNAEYNPRRLPAEIMRIREPKTTALIFATGKIVCTGTIRSQQRENTLELYKSQVILEFKFKDFKIQNIVASCDVRFPIRLEGLAMAHSSFSSYEPEIFPGLVYRMKKPKIVLLVFASGKIVITGAKVRDDLYAAFDNIYPVLTQFTKKSLAMS